MAIQFNCPYCTATIRVPDSAMGKKGTCPKCGTKVVVPEIEIPPQSHELPERPSHSTPDSPEFEPPPSESDTPQMATSDAWPVPSAAAPSADEPLPLPVDSSLPAGDAFVPPPPMPLRRRRRSSPWIPLVFLGLLLACIGYFYWRFQPRLEGELSARIHPEQTLDSVVVRRGMIPLSDGRVDAGLERLASEPMRLVSELMTVELEGTTAGIRVTLTQGPQTRFYGVGVTRNPSLQAFIERHQEEWDQRRRQELAQAAGQLMARLADPDRDPASEAIDYRDTVGLNALLGAFGYHVEAVAGGRIYPCVCERDGSLYFPLPVGTEEFEIRGRTLRDGQTPFPGHLIVRVAQPPVTGNQ